MRYDAEEMEGKLRPARAIVALAAVGLVAGGGTAPADPLPSSPAVVERGGGCNSITLGEPRVFYKNNMGCDRAKRYARRVYRRNGNWEPRNFSCESGSDFNEGGGCRHDSKPRTFFGWHPFD